MAQGTGQPHFLLYNITPNVLPQTRFCAVRDLDGFVPKSAKDFEEYAASIVAKYLLPHASNSNYKTLLKQLFRKALTPLTATDTKDVETSVAGMASLTFGMRWVAASGVHVNLLCQC